MHLPDLDGALYTLLAVACVMLGLAAWALMWRNAWRWRGRKLFLRILSGVVCGYVALVYLCAVLLEIPNETQVVSIMLRPAWVVMLALAAAFAIADY